MALKRRALIRKIALSSSPSSSGVLLPFIRLTQLFTFAASEALGAVCTSAP